MARIFAILLTLILLPSLAVAQSGNAGGGNSLQAQVEELYQLVSDLQAENAALQALIESNTSGISDNASGISGLQTSVGENLTAIATNASGISGNAEAIAAIDVSDLENAVAYYDGLLDGVSRTVVTVNDYRTDTDGVLALSGTEIEVPTLVFSGMNVQIVNGLEDTETANGAGNLIVGYNAERPEYDGFDCPEGFYCNRRWGSHMLVAGFGNNYTSFGGLLAGYRNEASGRYSSVSGGISNFASGTASSVSGGISNFASGFYSSVSGGSSNTASGFFSSVSGGDGNEASGDYSSVSGGVGNTASGEYSSVSGGIDKTAFEAVCVVGDDGIDC